MIIFVNGALGVCTHKACLPGSEGQTDMGSYQLNSTAQPDPVQCSVSGSLPAPHEVPFPEAWLRDLGLPCPSSPSQTYRMPLLLSWV